MVSRLVLRKDLSDNAGPYKVRCVGVVTKTSRIISMDEDELMFQSGLAAPENPASSAKPHWKNDFIDCGLGTFASLGKDSFQNFK